MDNPQLFHFYYWFYAVHETKRLTSKMEKQKLKNAKGQAVKQSPAAKTPPPAHVRVPPLFRKIDWLALVITFAVIWTVYFLTLAPEQTLQDSGELCTGAFYAGIPHPPGYPFWTIYAWLWTKLLLVGNVAWRVEVGEATAAALACGLVGNVAWRVEVGEATAAVK